MDKNILGSLLALETSSILSIIVFLSLIRPSFYYSKWIVFTCFFVTLFWFVVTAYSIIKRKKEEKGIKNYIISSAIYFVVIFYMIRTVWFHSYLNLAPEYSFFSGLCHGDTLYLSTLCEAIKNFGYPAVLSQGLSFHKYHFFSVVLFALISAIIKTPCLITYNYLYPVVFFPLFTYLFFQAVGVVRESLNKCLSLYISDVVLSLFVIVGFLPLRYIEGPIFIAWSCTILSESYFISLVLILLYIVLINYFKNKHKGEFIIDYIITPFFLLIITASKISVGIIFFIGLAWIYIRIRGIKISTVLSLVSGFILLLLCLSLFIRGSQTVTGDRIFWLHYIKTKVSPGYMFSHLFFILFPSILLFFLSKGSHSYSCFYKTKKAIFSEAALLVSCCGLLPSLFLSIEGGSAQYFFLPALFVSLFLLLCSSELQIQFANITKEKKIIVFLLVLIVYGESFLNDSYRHGSTNINVTPQYMIEQWRQGKRGNRRIISSQFYKSLNKINKLTEGKKQQYCLFVSDDCRIFKLYKNNNYYFIGSKGLLAITAYLGMPVITNLEESEVMQVKNIILLEKDTYRIVNRE